MLIDRLGNGIVRGKEVGGMVLKLVGLLGHANEDVREAARRAVRSMGIRMDRGTLEKLLKG